MISIICCEKYRFEKPRALEHNNVLVAVELRLGQLEQLKSRLGAKRPIFLFSRSGLILQNDFSGASSVPVLVRANSHPGPDRNTRRSSGAGGSANSWGEFEVF